MMLDWNDYRRQLVVSVKEIGQLSPDTIKGYMALSGAGQKADLLGAKVRELVALAVAVTLRCDGCITVHTEAAIKHGATKEIAEALGVATSVNAGAALVYSARVMDAFREYPRAASPHEAFPRQSAWVNSDGRPHAQVLVHDASPGLHKLRMLPVVHSGKSVAV
jgi:AhpD family alkylhydroperoxidase